MAETILSPSSYTIALAGGILPALLWLWFWLREDRANPEPTGLIFLSFAAGMAIVFFVLPIQKGVLAVLPFTANLADILAAKLALAAPTDEQVRTFLWAGTEEVAKFATVALIALHSRHFDEPIDAVIYLITAALGFAAMENTLYILKDMAHESATMTLYNSNLRFLGASILHMASSAIVGIALAFAFYGPRIIKFVVVILGLLLATLLHAYFNLSIMEAHGTWKTLGAFSWYWGAIILIIVLIQVIKRLKRPNTL